MLIRISMLNRMNTYRLLDDPVQLIAYKVHNARPRLTPKDENEGGGHGDQHHMGLERNGWMVGSFPSFSRIKGGVKLLNTYFFLFPFQANTFLGFVQHKCDHCSRRD